MAIDCRIELSNEINSDVLILIGDKVEARKNSKTNSQVFFDQFYVKQRDR